MKKNPLKNKDGSAILVAVVIMVVVMMLAMALLLISFSLFSTANRQQDLAQSREFAQTMSRMLEAEITVSVPDNADDTVLKEKYPLWHYLKETIGNSDLNKQWPPYDKKAENGKAKAYRYFNAAEAVSGGAEDELTEEVKELMKQTEILMYWENDNDTSSKPTDNETVLVVRVTCTSNRETTSITTRYRLNLQETEGRKVIWKWAKAAEGQDE